MTIKALYPNVRPSLDLNFARTKALDPRITFTRASTGTLTGLDGLVKTAAINVPRFDHTGTGESLGLLIEEARTNVVLYSEQFDNANWVMEYGTKSVTSNTMIAPDGTLTADTITGTGDSLWAQGSQLSGIKTFTCYLKAGSISTVDFRMFSGASSPNDCYASFNLSTGIATITSGAAFGVASMDSLPNGWYRCRLTRTDATSTFHQCHIRYGGGFFYAWGAQMEAGAFPTSYIPTTTATVTRAADLADITGANFTNYFNRTEGTYFVEASRPTGNQVGTGIQLFTGFIGAFDNSSYFTWRYQGTNSLVWSTVDNGSYREMYVDTGAATNIKIVGAYKSGSNAVAWNGAIRATDNRTSASGDTGFYLNRDRFGSATLVSQIKRIAYYPTRLSDTQLVSLSQ
jgi:hypothetical protein